MRKLLWSTLMISLVLVGCMQQEEDTEPTASKGEITSEGIFTNQDKGESVQLKRNTQSAARKAVDGLSIPGSSSYDSYGYNQQNPLLAFADYIHWLDYTVMSVVKLQFGQDPDLYYIQAVGQTCWNFTISSANALTIERIDQRSTSGYGTMTETGQSQIAVNWTVESGRGGLVFAIHTSTSYANPQTYDYSSYENPYWYETSYDPYQYGYQGYNNDSYYYYPPNPYSSPRTASSLRVTGTAYSCANTTLPYAGLSYYPSQGQTFDVDLSSYLNSYAGYMPYFKKSVSNGLISGRVVNFNGQDWWY